MLPSLLQEEELEYVSAMPGLSEEELAGRSALRSLTPSSSAAYHLLMELHMEAVQGGGCDLASPANYMNAGGCRSLVQPIAMENGCVPVKQTYINGR